MVYRLLIPIIISLCGAERYENYTLYRGVPVEESHLVFFRNVDDAYDVNYWIMPGSFQMPIDFVIGPNSKEAFLEEASKIGVYLTMVMEDVQSLCGAERYENYTLYRGVPVEESHLVFFRNLDDAYDVNYWIMPGSLQMPIDFVIGPNSKEAFLEEASKIGVYLTMVMEDVQSAFDEQIVKAYRRSQMNTFNWHSYHRTKDIYDWLYDLAKAFPRQVQIISIGKTLRNRDILAVRIVLKESLLRSKVIVEGGIHAREWISPAFVTYMLHQVLHSATSPNSHLRQIALTYEWYFVPVLNPDGYEYTFDQNRLWRKNRNNAGGVDLNRNFDYGFGSQSSSFNKMSDVYCGEKPFSERESMAMAKFVNTKRANLEYYLAFHSYGQYIILPYVRTLNLPTVKEMGLNAAEKIKSYHNTWYSVGTDSETLGYMVSGDSTGWVKKSFNIPYVATFELRDQGRFGFALPAKQIIPTCEETLGGLLVFLTPQTNTFLPKQYGRKAKSNIAGQTQTYLNNTVIMFYVTFIIMWFN